MRNRPHTSDARKPAQEIALPFLPAEKRKPTPTHLYALGCGPFVKIGVAIDVEVRRGILQKACPYEITILKTVLRQDFDAAHSAELALHIQFAEHRTVWRVVRCARSGCPSCNGERRGVCLAAATGASQQGAIRRNRPPDDQIARSGEVARVLIPTT